MRRLLLLVPVVAAVGAALVACKITDPTVTLECAAPDSGSYISFSNNSDTLHLHCFQKATP